jgi:hypothetical protein
MLRPIELIPLDRPPSAPVTAAQIETPAFPIPTPTPRKVLLPLGGEARMFTREHLTVIYRCSHGELGRLLARNMAPLPIRVDGTIFWYQDETMNALAQVMRTLERWRKR